MEELLAKLPEGGDGGGGGGAHVQSSFKGNMLPKIYVVYLT